MAVAGSRFRCPDRTLKRQPEAEGTGRWSGCEMDSLQRLWRRHWPWSPGIAVEDGSNGVTSPPAGTRAITVCGVSCLPSRPDGDAQASRVSYAARARRSIVGLLRTYRASRPIHARALFDAVARLQLDEQHVPRHDRDGLRPGVEGHATDMSRRGLQAALTDEEEVPTRATPRRHPGEQDLTQLPTRRAQGDSPNTRAQVRSR